MDVDLNFYLEEMGRNYNLTLVVDAVYEYVPDVLPSHESPGYSGRTDLQKIDLKTVLFKDKPLDRGRFPGLWKMLEGRAWERLESDGALVDRVLGDKLKWESPEIDDRW
jgi:hypothetical protein